MECQIIEYSKNIFSDHCLYFFIFLLTLIDKNLMPGVSVYQSSHKKVFYWEKPWEPTIFIFIFQALDLILFPLIKCHWLNLSFFHLITFRVSLDQKEISLKTQTTCHIQRTQQQQQKTYRLYSYSQHWMVSQYQKKIIITNK